MSNTRPRNINVQMGEIRVRLPAVRPQFGPQSTGVVGYKNTGLAESNIILPKKVEKRIEASMANKTKKKKEKRKKKK